MAYQASERLTSRTAHRSPESDSGVFFKAAATLLGLLVGMLGLVAVLMWTSAEEAKDEAARAAAGAAAPAAVSHDHGAAAAQSFAGRVPKNAEQIAAAHRPFPAQLPAVRPGSTVHVNLALQHNGVSIAPGIRYQAWTFAGGRRGP
jgi:hypothetical protein